MNPMMRPAVAVAVALMAASACGDDDSTAATTTTAVEETAEEFGARIDAECPGEEPGFDIFLGEHPEPSAADWAAFLPEPLEMVTSLATCIRESDPPTELKDGVFAVADALDVVAADLEEALESATAGDLTEAERWIGQMHDVDQPKVDEAIEAVLAAAGG